MRVSTTKHRSWILPECSPSMIRTFRSAFVMSRKISFSTAVEIQFLEIPMTGQLKLKTTTDDSWPPSRKMLALRT